MKKLFIFLVSLLLATNAYAADYVTTNYRLIVPEVGSRDWSEKISNDIITIDDLLYHVSNDVNNLPAITTSMDIISTDVNILKISADILCADSCWHRDSTRIYTYPVHLPVSVDSLSVDTTLRVVDYTFPTSNPTADGSVISYDTTTGNLIWGTVGEGLSMWVQEGSYIRPRSILADVSVDSLSVDTNLMIGGAYILTQDDGPAGRLLGTNGDGTTTWFPVGGSGYKIVGMTSVVTHEYLTTTSNIPTDSTAPQYNEGMQAFILSYDPINASNKLIIFVQGTMGSNVNSHAVFALFDNGTADAIAATSSGLYDAANMATSVYFRYVYTLSTDDMIEFQVRFGTPGATSYLNSHGGIDPDTLFGYTCPTGMTIMEVEP